MISFIIQNLNKNTKSPNNQSPVKNQNPPDTKTKNKTNCTIKIRPNPHPSPKPKAGPKPNPSLTTCAVIVTSLLFNSYSHADGLKIVESSDGPVYLEKKAIDSETLQRIKSARKGRIELAAKQNSFNFLGGPRVMVRSSSATAASVRKWMSPVKKQGKRGNCSVFAAIGLMEFFLQSQGGFSEQCLAKMSSDQDPGVVEDRIDWILKNGAYSEEDCPYHPSDRNVIPSLHSAKLTYLQGVQKQMLVPGKSDMVAAVRFFLKMGEPVGGSVYVVGDDWFRFNDLEPIDVPEGDVLKKYCDSPKNPASTLFDCPAHAVVFTGFNDFDETVEFKNSWGTTFKDSGYGKMTYDYLRTFKTPNRLVALHRQ